MRPACGNWLIFGNSILARRITLWDNLGYDMKLIGVIGGIGPESTIEYYRALLAEGTRHGVGAPPIIINSIDMKRLRRLVEADRLGEIADYLVVEVGRLASAGAAFGLIAAATPHLVFDDLRLRSAIPLLSLVEACCDEAKSRGLTRIGLFGTRFTMLGNFFPKVFAKANITLVIPGEEDRNFIHRIYFDELVNGMVLPETHQRLMYIVDRLKEQQQVQALILGGTELSLIFRGDSATGIPVLDATRIHAAAAVTTASR